MDELTLAAETDRAVRLALHQLDNPPKRQRPKPLPIAHMPSSYRPRRPDDEFARRWFAAASSITLTGAAQCADNS